MTTTATQLATGSGRFVRIMAIEGIDHLIVECSEADAQAAWDGTDWDSKPVYSGTFDVVNKQSCHPWEPFQPGGTATVTVLDDDFGILTHRTAGGAETELTLTIDRDDTTINVQDTSQFPTSGEFHIGTECVAYESPSTTKFTGTTRGMYSPFGTSSGSRYTHDHRVGVTSYGPNLMPKVTQYPRHWKGRWVGIWLHTYDENGINAKADARCIFAGHIAEIHDTEDGTVMVCEHALTALKNVSLGRDMFQAEVADGVYLAEGDGFGHKDFSGTTWKTANALDVVASGASGTNQINEGFYSHDDLMIALNAWWAGEVAASRIHGSYTISINPSTLRCEIAWNIPGSGAVNFGFYAPNTVAYALGFHGTAPTAPGQIIISDDGTAGDPNTRIGDYVPLRSVAAVGSSLIVENVNTAPVDQYDWLPLYMKPASADSLKWGVFNYNEKGLIRAAFKVNSDGSYTFSRIVPQSLDVVVDFAKRIDDATPTTLRQVLMLEMPWGDWWKRMALSTGTAGYNDSTWDVLPFGIPLGWPGELFSTAFLTSIDNAPGSDLIVTIYLDKTKKLTEINAADLVLRHAFPVWKSGGFCMATWQSPNADLAVAALTEDNKAEPAGNQISQRSTTVLHDQWAKPVIKILYNRYIDRDGYRDTINIEDSTAVDDSGNLGEPFTIEVKNSFADTANNSDIASLVPAAFIPPITMFTRAARVMRRSISPTEYEDLAPGDIVLATDKFARDPITGLREVTSRPATIISHTYSLGGARPGGERPDDMVGEVELMFVETNRIFSYAPSALVSLYTSGTKTLTLSAHEYSESSEDDDVDYFPASGAIRISEVDPEDPSTAITYTRTIASKSGNDIVHSGVALGTDTGETAFDAGKEYRVTFDAYGDVIAIQQAKAFQADDSDGLIEDDALPNMFGVTTSTVAATASTHTDLPEFHAAVDYGDGKAYDVGSLKGFARLVNNLIDHKTAISSPQLGATASNSDYSSGDGRKLTHVQPIFLTRARSTAAVPRYLSVAPWLRSSDGTSTTVRVTLAPNPPTDDTVEDIGIISNSSTAIFTTSSTTWSVPNAVELPISVKTGQIAWLVIECGYKAETRGIAHCHEGERS